MADDRHTIRLSSREAIAKAHAGVEWCASRLADGWQLVLTRKRTLDQNDRLHPILRRIAEQRPEHYGMAMSADDYKVIFLDALDDETRICLNLDGSRLVTLGRQSSKLTVREFSDLFAVIEAWCSREGIDIGENNENDKRDA